MRLLLALFFAVVLSPSVAGEIAVSAPDPFTLQFAMTCCGNAPNSKTLSSQTIDTTKRNLVIVAAGQSLAGDNSSTAYTPTNGSKIDNLYLYDGGIYQASDPLLGPTNDGTSLGPGNFLLRLADDLITAGLFDRVIICPIGVGGTTIAGWDTGLESDRFGVAYRRLAAKGIVPGLTNTTIVILWIQGEQDNANGTTQLAYSTGIGDVITAARNAGFTQGLVPFFVPEESWNAGTVSTAVENAQIAIINHGSNIWAGPNSDAFNGNVCGSASNAACRQADNTHLTAAGAYSNAGTGGGGWRAALHAYGPPF